MLIQATHILLSCKDLATDCVVLLALVRTLEDGGKPLDILHLLTRNSHRVDLHAPPTLGPGRYALLRRTKPDRRAYGALDMPVNLTCNRQVR